jgi:hypothetical protein
LKEKGVSKNRNVTVRQRVGALAPPDDRLRRTIQYAAAFET